MKTQPTPYSPYDPHWNSILRVPLLVLSVAFWIVTATSSGAEAPVQNVTNATPTEPDQVPEPINHSKPSQAAAEEDQPEVANQGVRLQGVRLQKDQRFSEQAGRAGLCDVYSPAADPPANGFPVVVVIHGGGWASGDKWTIASYSRLLAKEGIVAVTINYRLAPAHKFPAQADDVRSALVWVNQQAKRLHLNTRQIGLFGYSAGGHLSVLLGALADESMVVRASASNWSIADPRWKQLPKITAVCAGGPPCDFRSLPIDNSAMAYFLGGTRRDRPETYKAASPAAHVSANDPVTQLFHGEGDALVPIAGTRQFHQSQVDAGIDSRLEVIPKQGHMLTFISPKTYQTVVEFFRELFFKSGVASPS